MKYIHKTPKGFTLIEMSIVIIIIAFITAAVVAGSSLEENARIQNTVKELRGFMTAQELYMKKYHNLPVKDHHANNAGSASDVQVNRVMAWKDLSDEGFIQGNYTGTLSSGDVTQGEIGVNVPKSALNDFSGYVFDDDRNDTIVAGPIWYLSYFIRLGAHVTGEAASDSALEGSTLKPKQAKAIDLKMDDGLIYTGLIQSNNGIGTSAGSHCEENFVHNSGEAATARYNLDGAESSCVLVYYYELPTQILGS